MSPRKSVALLMLTLLAFHLGFIAPNTAYASESYTYSYVATNGVSLSMEVTDHSEGVSARLVLANTGIDEAARYDLLTDSSGALVGADFSVLADYAGDFDETGGLGGLATLSVDRDGQVETQTTFTSGVDKDETNKAMIDLMKAAEAGWPAGEPQWGAYREMVLAATSLSPEFWDGARVALEEAKDQLMESPPSESRRMINCILGIVGYIYSFWGVAAGCSVGVPATLGASCVWALLIHEVAIASAVLSCLPD